MDRIGKYEVLEKIGAGGFGEVFKGRDPFIKRLVAIKTCAAEDEKLRERFLREAEIAGRLQHPNVTLVYDFGYHGEIPYLVQEYLSGEDLQEKLQRGDPLTLGTKVDYLLQIAEALEYAHGMGVIHRDIKPSNIRVLEGDLSKIMDFGIGKLTHEETRLTATGVTLGTPGYLAPEQIRGEEADARVDIFAFGVLAYELLGGRRPFVGSNVSVVFYQILNEDPRPLDELTPQCPPELNRIVDNCLAKEPEDRYRGFSELLEELRPVREDLRGTTAESTVILADDLVAPDEESREALAAGALARMVRRIEGYLRRGELRKAEETLTRAEKTHGKDDSLAELRQRIEELGRTVVTEAQDIEELVGGGRLEEASGRLLAAISEHGQLDVFRDLQHKLGKELSRREGVPAPRTPTDLRLSGRALQPTPSQAFETVGKGRLVRVVAGVVMGLAVLAAGGWWLLYSERQVGPTSSLQVASPPRTHQASLEVSSVPPGAAVWVNGEDRGLVTPARVEVEGELGDTVELELRRDGEPVASTTIALGPGMPRQWVPELAPLLETYRIVSQPQGARVILNGEPLEGTTPLEVGLDPRQEHVVQVELDGYRTAGRTFSLQDLSGAQRTARELAFRLEAAVPPGYLVVEAAYPVQVSVAGQRFAVSGSREIPLRPGGYDVEVAAPEVFYWGSSRVEVESGDRQPLILPAAVEVTIGAVPSHCRIKIDGRDAGTVPLSQRLVVGDHDFEFHWPNLGKSLSATETVRLDTKRIFRSAQ